MPMALLLLGSGEFVSQRRNPENVVDREQTFEHHETGNRRRPERNSCADI